MAKTGDRFDMVDSSSYIVTRAAAETNGEYVEMEFVLPPGCLPPPPHVHPSQVEEYEVLEGRFDVMVDGEWKTFDPGQKASVPVGVLHTFRNKSGETVRVRNWHRPALRFEEYIERIHATLRRTQIKSKRDPRIPLYLSQIMLEYSETLAPGRARERVPIRAAAGLGRLLRLRPGS
jgi:quercetin dioxygenase-like cupin family protein